MNDFHLATSSESLFSDLNSQVFKHVTTGQSVAVFLIFHKIRENSNLTFATLKQYI
jgi:hypothetical protein